METNYPSRSTLAPRYVRIGLVSGFIGGLLCLGGFVDRLALAEPNPQLPDGSAAFSENFDGVTAPALPANWIATNNAGAAPFWATSTLSADTAPNTAFIDDPQAVSDKRLTTPNISITSTSAQLSFRNFYSLEQGFDGGVLEVSSPNIAGGAFVDVASALVGGSFVSGGYTQTIPTQYQSPIGGRMAWSGLSGGYITTVVNLGPNVAGQIIKLRFRMASDASVSSTGWRVDTITVIDGAGGTGHFANISTRLRVETGENVLIGGFIVTGTQAKRVIMRALGPSLSVTGAISDPVLELRNSAGVLVLFNDDWKEDQQAEIIATGIPPTHHLESAIVATLPANNSSYTGVVRGYQSATGIGVVEVYDLDPAANSKLANISTRGFVGTGNDVMIGGTIVAGGQANVLLRAIGPSLVSAGIQNAISDTTLELRDGNGTAIAANDDWRDSQEAAIVATGIPPTNDLESAILRTLAPGAYTAIVRGFDDATGVALVEAYQLQ